MKSYFEEHGGTYTKIGDYLLPNLVMDPQPEGEIGIWGWRRKRYLKEHRKGTWVTRSTTFRFTRANAKAMCPLRTLSFG